MYDGMDIIREALYGRSYEGTEPTLGMMESGMASIREALYGFTESGSLFSSYSNSDGSFTKYEYLQEASKIVDFLYNSNNNSYIESGLAEINESLGYSFRTMYESADEATRYMANGLWILTEAAKKDDKITAIKAKIDSLDNQKNAPKALVALYTALVIIFVAAGFVGMGYTIYHAGSALASLQSVAMRILVGMGLGYVIGWVTGKLIDLGISGLRYFTTYIYNKITGNNVVPPNEKQLAIKDMIKTVDKYMTECRHTGQIEKVKQLTEIKADLQNRLDEILNDPSFTNRMA